jgi:hypothetical protein
MPIRIVLIVIAALVVAAFVIRALIRFAASSRAGIAHDAQMTAAFVPNPANDSVVVVRGWSESDVKRILRDFLPAYELRADSVTVTAETDSCIKLKFPHDIQPKILYFLVNYIQYPKDFDLKRRSIGVVGRVVLNRSFGVPDTQLIGKPAEIYVPANDTDYDLVYARVDSGDVYEISFTDLIWRRAEGARIRWCDHPRARPADLSTCDIGKSGAAATSVVASISASQRFSIP